MTLKLENGSYSERTVLFPVCSDEVMTLLVWFR